MANKKTTTTTKVRNTRRAGSGAAVGAEPEGLSRQKEICETVRQAMNDLAKKREVNWMREGAEVEQAAVGLSAAMVDYVEGKGSKGNVRSAYKQYINTLEGTDGNAGGS